MYQYNLQVSGNKRFKFLYIQSFLIKTVTFCSVIKNNNYNICDILESISFFFYSSNRCVYTVLNIRYCFFVHNENIKIDIHYKCG